jgi:hypothetical protein
MGHPTSWKYNRKLYLDFKEVFTVFMDSPTLTKAFRARVHRFLVRYWMINTIGMIRNVFPFIKKALLKLQKNKLFAKMISYVYNPLL